jgi:hypothetical protein
MITLLPEPGTYGATVVAGLVNTGDEDPTNDVPPEKMRGVVVLKATYDLEANGAGPRRPVLAGGTAPHAIRFSDVDPVVVDDQVVGTVFVAEADIALEKARTDIVVEGLIAGSDGGLVKINGTVWLQRDKGAAPDGDVATNLFGWHGRGEDNRKLSVGAWVKAPPGDWLPPVNTAHFNNFYRRSDKFTAPGNVVPLPLGGTVVINNKVDETGTSYSFTLPTDNFSARVRTFCGDCPDKPNRWCIAEAFALVPDTLIVKPAANTATVIWRGGWDWDSHPTESYRAVEILREEA